MEAHAANAAILLFKSDAQTVRLLVFARGTAADAPIYSEYDFSYSDTDERAEIVALKTAEVVPVFAFDSEYRGMFECHSTTASGRL